MSKQQVRRLIFSGINITQGGPLTMMRHFHAYAAQYLTPHFEVYFLVKHKSLLPDSGVRIIAFPNAQRSIFHKLYYEYIYFKSISRQLQPLLWFSLNDITPNVTATVQCVYFHNATPFYGLSLMDLRFPSRVIFQKFYYYFFYRINLFRNKFVVVQQKFMRNYVASKLKFPNDRILLNRPALAMGTVINVERIEEPEGGILFLYPTKAEVYKNIHVIVDAVQLLKAEKIPPFRVMLTLTGDENRYSRFLKRKGKGLPEIQFIGYQPFDNLMNNFQRAHCILFPSQLETWGLPLSEAMYFKKWIIAADLEYARETIGEYPAVHFFNPESPASLAAHMLRLIVQRDTSRVPAFVPEPPVDDNLNMDELFKRIL